MLFQNKISRLVLGTAQIGLSYGPNKNNYIVSEERAEKIFTIAHKLGIRYLDTATGYGEGHCYIGKYHQKNPENKFKIFTKITSEEFKKNSHVIDEILNDLNIDTLEGVLLHRQEDTADQELRAYLESEKSKGKIVKVGLSLYYDDSFCKNIDLFNPDFIQLPFNVLDNSVLRKKEFELLRERKILVQGRSCLLRGAFSITDTSKVPQEILPWIEQIKVIATSWKLTPNQLCLNYVIQNSNIAQVLIGIDTIEQLVENVQSLEIALSSDLFEEIEKIKIENSELLDLRKW